jgi:hypothetical protein
MSGNFNFPAATYANVSAIGNTTFTGGTTTFGGSGYDTVYLNGTGNPLTLAPSATWTGSFNIYGQAAFLTFANQGTIDFTSGSNTVEGGNNGLTVANSGTINVTAGSTYFGYYANDQIVNQATGVMTANGPSAILNLGYNASALNNLGTLLATNGGTINIGGTYTTANLGGTISATSGGVLNLLGALNNTGATLNAPAAGVYTLDGATITGGTIAGGALTFNNSGGTLDGVTLTGNFSLPASSYAYFTVKNNTTFTGGTTTFTTSGYDTLYLGSAGTTLTVAAGETWSGSFNMYSQVANGGFDNQGTIDMGAGSANIYGNGNGFGFQNGGTLDKAGGNLYLGYYSNDSFTNLAGGTLEASGGTIYVGDGSSTVTNLAGGTLTGGTWDASAGGMLSFEGTTPINTIASGTTVVLDGAGSTIRTKSGAGPSYQNIEQTLTVVDGTLGVIANRNFASTSAGITNNGVVELGGGTLTAASLTSNPGSSLIGYGTFGPTGGVTVGNGVLVSPGVNVTGTYIGTLSFNSLQLGSGGSMQFDIKNSSAPVAGTDNDTLAVTGNLNVTASPGTPFTISLESINPGTGAPGLANFNMAQSYQWTLASAGSISNFNAADFSIDTSSFANSLGATGFFTVTAGANDIYLNFLPVPEPSTWALVAAGVLMIAGAAWRRRPAKALR